ncbi:MAG: glycerate kinase [Spirochaetales bacterium]|nr:glycerate kinase [Spirochaetales bacterium]MCF7937109.1 glycerate kinase [Spirochaetales bacterium]
MVDSRRGSVDNSSLNLRAEARAVFNKAVSRVDPRRMILDRLVLKQESPEQDLLLVRGEGRTLRIDLHDYKEIIVLGAGKAGADMAAGLEAVLGNRITGGLVVVKYGHTASGEDAGELPRRIEIAEAGHPVPDSAGLEAASRLAGLAEKAGEETLVFVLISGGGSALIPLPAAGSGIRLEDKQETTRLLLESGADINEVNSVRKHLSGIKGGTLAKLLSPARTVSLVLSDVVGDDLDAIASGPTVPDSTSFSDALSVVDRYDLRKDLPATVVEQLLNGVEGRIPDTPKPDNPFFERTDTVLLGNNASALAGAAEQAKEQGYLPVVLSSSVTGEASEIAGYYLGILRDYLSGREFLGNPPLCIIGGGETTMTIRGSGLGGRNQEMALSFLSESKRLGLFLEGSLFLCAGTDGNDGPTDAAGAFADTAVLEKAAAKDLDPADYLERNDSYRFFSRVEGLFLTGPTNTNVCDIHLLFIT